MKKIFLPLLLSISMFTMLASGCDEMTARQQDMALQQEITDTLSKNQATPTDIDYSLERYNLIKRAYWVNGQREKANAVTCPIEIPIGYIVLFSDMGDVITSFEVDGKVSSLMSYLTPESEYYEYSGSVHANEWVADVDGSYGLNSDGVFFFTIDGKYVEWTGKYLYSDIPFKITDPILEVADNG